MLTLICDTVNSAGISLMSAMSSRKISSAELLLMLLKYMLGFVQLLHALKCTIEYFRDLIRADIQTLCGIKPHVTDGKELP